MSANMTSSLILLFYSKYSDEMNIFFLHKKARKCAKYHCNKHVIKMILETCQILCTTWHVVDPHHNIYEPVYKKTHINHPSVKWARESVHHYKWLAELGIMLCKEYTYRYYKTHKCEQYLISLKNNIPLELPNIEWKDPPQAMPEEFKRKTSIKGYRNYYKKGKIHVHAWKDRHVPPFVLKK